AELLNSLELDLHELGLFKKWRPTPITAARKSRRGRTPQDVANQAQARLALISEQMQKFEMGGQVERAKNIADLMRHAVRHQSVATIE
ncbi:MAG: hypothetical protein KAY02_05705, partial [Acidovorax sp.]|nr:hypothetical protein [Acidovorax sp.]